MSVYDNEELQLACPNQKCKRQMRVRYRDVYSSRRTKCTSCGTEINFDSSAASEFRSSLENMANLDARYRDDSKRAQERINKSIAGILKNADIKMKL